MLRLLPLILLATGSLQIVRLVTAKFSDYLMFTGSTSNPLVQPMLAIDFEEGDEGMAEELVGRNYSLSELFNWKRPTGFLPTRFSNSSNLPGSEALVVLEVSRICPKNEFFYGMNPRHRIAVSRLKDLLIEQGSPQEWIELAEDLRDHEGMNPHVWLRAVVSSLINRTDIQERRLPPIAEVIPSLFFTTEILDAVNGSVNSPSELGGCIFVDGSDGLDNGAEHLAWYWREDIMVNSHHWYWHLAYPFEGVGLDRGGELFYFMHHDMLARYHSERLSVGLAPVRIFDTQPGSRIPLPYNPRMHDGNSGRSWSPRPPRVPVSDVTSGATVISVENRSIQMTRISNGISQGFLIDRNGQPISLKNERGISLLGNTIEATEESVNPENYGTLGIHNDGHLLISLAMDPRNESGLAPGVMGDTATAMRDIMFYQYHGTTDKMFKTYKDTLPSYKLRQGEWPLLSNGIRIRSLQVRSKNLPRNVLRTFWSSASYDLSRGLDFGRSSEEGPMWVCVKHLNHQDFEYELQIVRQRRQRRGNVTVRLFGGPRYDLNGRRYTLEQQRQFMFILDTFTVQLKFGRNTIRRKSTETPLTIGFDQSVLELQNGSQINNSRPFCGCGWPHHLLLPKGNRRGLSLDIFAMITNEGDETMEPIGPGATQESCKSAYIYCGLMGQKYPDRRPMGYPFDRKSFVSDKSQRTYLEHLVRQLPNSAAVHVKVLHFDEFREPRRSCSSAGSCAEGSGFFKADTKETEIEVAVESGDSE